MVLSGYACGWMVFAVELMGWFGFLGLRCLVFGWYCVNLTVCGVFWGGFGCIQLGCCLRCVWLVMKDTVVSI